MGCIYIAVSNTTEKVYVGQTIDTLEFRKYGHKNHSKNKNGHFQYAIRKYGWDDFYWTEIYKSDDIDVLNEKEKFYIKLYDSYCNGYNSTTGGDNCKMSVDTRLKMMKSHAESKKEGVKKYNEKRRAEGAKRRREERARKAVESMKKKKIRNKIQAWKQILRKAIKESEDKKLIRNLKRKLNGDDKKNIETREWVLNLRK